jgi:DNA-binding FrmR family transcriptional regulator
MDHTAQIPRLNRIEGQIGGIRRMIEEGRYCIDILTQIRSVSSALAKVQENIFQAHLESCVKDSLTGGDPKDREVKINEILEILSKFR